MYNDPFKNYRGFGEVKEEWPSPTVRMGTGIAPRTALQPQSLRNPVYANKWYGEALDAASMNAGAAAVGAGSGKKGITIAPGTIGLVSTLIGGIFGKKSETTAYVAPAPLPSTPVVASSGSAYVAPVVAIGSVAAIGALVWYLTR